MHTYTHTWHMHTHVYIYVHTCIHVCTQVHKHVYTYVHMCINTYTSTLRLKPLAALLFSSMQTHYAHICVHTCTYKYIHLLYFLSLTYVCMCTIYMYTGALCCLALFQTRHTISVYRILFTLTYVCMCVRTYSPNTCAHYCLDPVDALLFFAADALLFSLLYSPCSILFSLSFGCANILAPPPDEVTKHVQFTPVSAL